MKLSTLAGCGVLSLTMACGAADSEFESGTEESAEQDLSSYKTAVGTNPSPVIAGAPTALDVRVTGPNNTPVTQFDLLHTEKMHLIAVSSDLEDFIHVHPALGTAGHLTTTATFARQQPYALFMEYDPAGPAASTLSRAKIMPSGAHTVQPTLDAASAFGGSSSKTVAAGGTLVELVGAPGGMIMPNVPAHLVVRFRKTNGTPINDLTTWLGMPAHAIVVSPDLKTFVHAHGMAESGGGADHDHDHMGTSTGPVGVDVTLPKAGLYKMFLQFKRGSTLITAPFVLKAMSGHGPPPPTPSCATMTCPSGQHCMVMGSPPAPMCM